MTGNTPEDFAKRYDEMTDDALLDLANGGDELVPEAEAALYAEMERRQLHPAGPMEDVAEHRDLVVVDRFRDLTAAQLAQGALRSAGVDATLRDDSLVRMDWWYSNAVGGIRLLVDRENVEAAGEILNQAAPESFEAEGGEFHRLRCPKCESSDTEFQQINKPLSVAAMYFLVPIPIVKNKWHCNNCRYEWEQAEQ